MASTRIDIKSVRDKMMCTFVDDFYFPRSGLPPMSVFHGACGYICDFDHFDVKLANESAETHRSSVTPETSPSQSPDQSPAQTSSSAEKFMSKKKVRKLQDFCEFCKNNRESEHVYRSHRLKDKCNRVVCPRLREYKCTICGAFGDNAHTIKHCPQRDVFPKYENAITSHRALSTQL